MNLLSIFLMAPQGGGEAAQGSAGSGLIMMLLILVIFYLFLIRPQAKKQKAVNEFRKSLQKGDKVLTVGGIYGTIAEVKETTVLLEVSNGVLIKVDKAGLVKDPADVTAQA